jgi:hypothetical protein
MHYGTLAGVSPGSPAAWALPGSFAVLAIIGLAWGADIRKRRPDVYAAIGQGAYAVTSRATITFRGGRP